MRAPVSRRVSGRASGELVLDNALVGGLGLLGEFAFGLAHHGVGAPDPGRLACVLSGAGGDLEAAELFK